MDITRPAYVFDIDKFHSVIKKVKSVISDIPLTYSIKANPILAAYISEDVSHIEVCSPGEYEICNKINIEGKKIIYSGVLKTEDEIKEALCQHVDIITIESYEQYKYLCEYSKNNELHSNVIIRLSSGNQFGVSEEILFKIMEENTDSGIKIHGLHYYSGTQKKRIELIENDLKYLSNVRQLIEDRYHFKIEFLEYGPGLSFDYFDKEAEKLTYTSLEQLVYLISQYGLKDIIGLEFGRLLASVCGKYYTTVYDIKETNGVKYIITDGGTHQLRYYGQNMAMRVPPIRIVDNVENEGITEKYCICGSLCTVADVMVRECELPSLKIGNVIEFGFCGAYSATEASALFLSRDLPAIYIKDNGKLVLIRKKLQTNCINIGGILSEYGTD